MPEKQNNNGCFPCITPREWLRSKFRVDPENIPRLVYPLAQFIHEQQPDYILALDCGARLPALALFALHEELYGELPSKDRRIHFCKVSHSFPPELIRNQLRPHVQQTMSLGESPSLFVVDDCVNTGTTTLMLRLLVSELSQKKVRLKVGVMREFLTGVTDVRGDSFSLARATWRNNSRLIGVGYHDRIVPSVVQSVEALELRKQVFANTKDFAAKIKNGKI